MVLTNDEALARQVKLLSLHGMSAHAWSRFSEQGYRHYDVLCAGFKYNMMDLQAAIGLHQVKRVQQYFTRRQVIWQRYWEAFAHLPVQLPAPLEPGTVHGRHLFTLLVEPAHSPVTRDAFIAALHQRKIGTGGHYRAIPVHPYNQERYGWRPEAYPHAHAIGQATVSLPLSAKLTDADVDDVIQAVCHTLQA